MPKFFLRCKELKLAALLDAELLQRYQRLKLKSTIGQHQYYGKTAEYCTSDGPVCIMLIWHLKLDRLLIDVQR